MKDFTFLYFLSATLLIEVFMLYLFRYTKSQFSGKAINKWYTNYKWSAVILDVLSVLIGFYLAKFSYQFLTDKKILNEKYIFIKYLIILLLIQISHDFIFYFLTLKDSVPGKNKIIDELTSYAKDVSTGAVIGDSFMYLIGTPILFFLTSKLSNDKNTFISIACLYLIGYFIYQKPII